MLIACVMVAVWIALALPVAAITLPVTWITGNPALLYRWGLWVVRTGLRAGNIRVVAHMHEALPLDTPCIYMANHVSNLDPPVLASVSPGHSALMLKSSLMKIPILGTAMRLSRFVPVERSGSMEGAKDSLRRSAEVLRSGLHLTIFVEGTRSPDGQLLPFKKGPFYLAMESGVPVVPVTIAGTGAMLPKGGLRLTPGTAHVTFHAPLYPAQFANRTELQKAVRAAIASALPAQASDALQEAEEPSPTSSTP